MRKDAKVQGRTICGAITLLVALAAIGIGRPHVSTARVPATAVTIVNNSSRDIRHLYLSATTDNNWGADQLDPSTISAAGGTFTLSDVSCSAADLKLIAEDQDGCFIYKVVACGVNTTWTITNESVPDCGN